MKIVLASRNKNKVSELLALLSEHISDIEVLSLNDVGIYGDIEESGETFEENALIKACVAATSGYIGIGDDSGLSVDALGGAPGVYSARYAGEHGNDAANNALLLENLRDVSDRSARFVCTIACVFPKDAEIDPIIVRGEVEGRIIDDARGECGFGYDPIFYYPPFGKTLAELDPCEKNKVSHRARAIEALAQRLREITDGGEKC